MKVFAPVLKRQMKDCILALFWPKKEIHRFLKDCSVPTPVLRAIEGWDEKGLSRAEMVDRAFDTLDRQPDNGTFHFDQILETLSTWNHFDDYWFTAQQTLDPGEARRTIDALRKAKDGHVDSVRRRAVQERERTASAMERHASLQEMRKDFQAVSMGSATPQARGYAFEAFLAKMARFFGLRVTGPFRVEGTQIDGTLKYDGENYAIEAKWHDRRMSDEPLLAFCRKQEMNMHGRGIFVSINGFSEGALSILERGSVKNTVLMDGEDIALILQELTTLPETLDRKIHAAQTRGLFYVHPVTGDSKIKA